MSCERGSLHSRSILSETTSTNWQIARLGINNSMAKKSLFMPHQSAAHLGSCNDMFQLKSQNSYSYDTDTIRHMFEGIS
ncbi:hypothetical protein PCAR4_290043 [Paraburkholderia caribensis]|nr:hypothetical protein PCAR4_290043 [Paraburkholderia caribensis]